MYDKVANEESTRLRRSDYESTHQHVAVPRLLSSSEPVCLLGNLILSHPKMRFLPIDGWIVRVMDLLPELIKLSDRYY